jgi:hypothetical protein
MLNGIGNRTNAEQKLAELAAYVLNDNHDQRALRPDRRRLP